MNIFHQICEIFSHYFFRYFLPALFSLPFHYGCIGTSFGVPLVCEALFVFLHLFFFLFPRLDIDTPIFKFPDSFLAVHIYCLAPLVISFILLFVLLSSRVSISFHNLCLFIDIFYFVRCCDHTLIL